MMWRQVHGRQGHRPEHMPRGIISPQTKGLQVGMGAGTRTYPRSQVAESEGEETLSTQGCCWIPRGSGLVLCPPPFLVLTQRPKVCPALGTPAATAHSPCQ